MTGARTSKGVGTERSGLTPRAVVGIVAAVLLVVWVLVNRDEVSVSFLFWTARLPLWVVIAVAGLLGATAGFFAGRRRYRR